MSARLPGSIEPISCFEPERLGGIDGRHLERALDRHAGRVEMAHVLHQGADLHLLDHVDRVVDHRAVGAERDVDAGAMRVGERRDAAAADRFARRRVDEARADPRHVLDVELGDVDAMDQDPVRIEDAELHQVAHVGAAGLAQVAQKTLFERERAAGDMRA